MLQEEFNIANLIARFIALNITDDELAALELWKNASDENKQLFELLIRPEHQDHIQQMASRYDVQEAWDLLQAQLSIQEKKRKNSLWRHWYYYAAALLLLPLVIAYFVQKQPGKNTVRTGVVQKEISAVITPGSSKATLTMADGSQVSLDKKEKFELEENGATINNDSSVLNYKSVNTASEPVYNQLDIPRGGEYSLVLSDGTKVYLNAMTSLRFPVQFVGDERRVELQGEAYFEVVHSDKPFIVQTKETQINVMGTSFNVSSYQKSECTQTTVVSGKVKVELRNSKETVYLTPSQQAVFNRETGKLSVEKVDVSSFIAWKNGLFYFKDWRLEDIMTSLSRWYDIEVTYLDKNVMDYRFGCKFDRYGEITPILELFERTNKVNVKVNGNKIILRDKK